MKAICYFIVMMLALMSCKKEDQTKPDSRFYDLEFIDLTTSPTSTIWTEVQVDSIIFHYGRYDTIGVVNVITSNGLKISYPFVSSVGGGPNYSPPIILANLNKANFIMGDDGGWGCVIRLFVIEEESLQEINLQEIVEYGYSVRIYGIKKFSVNPQKRKIKILYNAEGYHTGPMPDKEIMVDY